MYLALLRISNSNRALNIYSGVDIVAILQWFDVGETLVQKLQKGNGTLGYLAVASAMYKIATPARYAVTLGK